MAVILYLHSRRQPTGRGTGMTLVSRVDTQPPALPPYFGLHSRLCSRFYLSPTKVSVRRVAGSPRGYGHDILIKSVSTADYITQESKINHSQGSGIIQA